MTQYTIGLDYGSLSCRGVLARVGDGTIAAEASFAYPHGAMDGALPDGTPLERGWVVQHPADFRQALGQIVPALLRSGGIQPGQIVGIGVDFTSSTVIPLNQALRPLAEDPAFSGRPHAWPKMWKHNAAQPQAEAMTAAARRLSLPYPDWYGGAIPCQSLLPKVIQVFQEDPEVFQSTACFLEAGDYITSLLTGKLSASCAMAAARAVWTPEAGYPDGAFFCAVDPGLERLPEKLALSRPDCARGYPGQRLGGLSEEMAQCLGLLPGTAVTAAQMDGYAALPALGVTQPGEALLVMGTSTAVMLLGQQRHSVEGITACVRDTIYPGCFGYASGQSSVGDGFQWFVDNCVPEGYGAEAARRGISLHQYLTELAAPLEPGQTGLLALDWLGGNKSCLANSRLSGAIVGLNLKTRPEHIYRALQEATAYGCRTIVEAYAKAGVPVRTISACGGIAKKNPILMQMYADILGTPIRVSTCGQAPALGSAIYAAAAAGVYADSIQAAEAMHARETVMFDPDGQRRQGYEALYRSYSVLHDYFGRENHTLMEALYVGRGI